MINIRPDGEWLNAGRPVTYRGSHISDLPSPWDKIKAIALWPLRRNYSHELFSVIARVGDKGNDEYRLSPDPDVKDGLQMQFVSRRDGELYFYINDLVLPLPFDAGYFYRDNVGSAKIEVRRVRQ